MLRYVEVVRKEKKTYIQSDSLTSIMNERVSESQTN